MDTHFCTNGNNCGGTIIWIRDNIILLIHDEGSSCNTDCPCGINMYAHLKRTCTIKTVATKKMKSRPRSLVLPAGSLQLILSLDYWLSDELLPVGVMIKKQQDR